MDHPAPTVSSESALAELERIHRQVDQEAAALAHIHKSRLQCEKGCSQCCVDGLNVFEIEAMHIRRHFHHLLESGRPGRVGVCAFLDKSGGCSIYRSRPYVCRTQGLPLRWLEEQRGSRVEFRDICPLNEEGTPVEELPAEDCWTLGPVEEELARLQSLLDGGEMLRVPLRSLFRS